MHSGSADSGRPTTPSDPLTLLLVDTQVSGDCLDSAAEIETRSVREPDGALAAVADGTVDCVTSAYALSETDGLALYEQVRDEDPTMPFVLVADENEAVAAEALNAGVDGYIRADGQIADELAERVLSVVEQRRARQSDRPGPPYPSVVAAITDPARSFEERLRAALRIGRDYLGLDHGFLSNTRDGIQDIEVAVGDHPMLQDGASAPLDASYCKTTIESAEPRTIESAQRAGMDGTTAYAAYELESYIGSRVGDPDRPYGTVCFSGMSARSERFTPAEREFVSALSNWVAYELERESGICRADLETAAAELAHDIRSPLQVADGRLELLAHERDSEHVERAQEAVRRADELADTLPSLLADDGPTTTEVSLAAVAGEAVETVPLPAAQVEIAGDRTLRAERTRLRQLLENLLRNARDHVGPDVRVTVAPTDDGFAVADDGPGIPLAERETVFETGYSTAASSGFGLAIVREVADNHGWTVTVAGSDAGGARFVFTTD